MVDVVPIREVPAEARYALWQHRSVATASTLAHSKNLRVPPDVEDGTFHDITLDEAAGGFAGAEVDVAVVEDHEPAVDGFAPPSPWRCWRLCVAAHVDEPGHVIEDAAEDDVAWIRSFDSADAGR